MTVLAPGTSFPPAWVFIGLATAATTAVWWHAFVPVIALMVGHVLWSAANAYVERKKAQARETDDPGDDAFWTNVGVSLADFKRRFL